MQSVSYALGREIPLRELYPPREVEHILSISHAQLYRLLGAGRLTAVKIGRSSYIPRGRPESPGQ
jgi:hypothetical protein